MSNYTLFISDLHLTAHRPELTQLFLQFLRSTAYQADALYILGDLFEFWIGDDDTTPLSQTVKMALHDLSTAGVPLFIMPGNRDFLLGQRFMQETGAVLLADPMVIELYGEQILLMHGDLLCTDDIAYLKFRAWTHRPVIKKLFLTLPLWLRQKIALGIRQRSQEYVQSALSSIMDASILGISKYTHQYGTKQLIHGHTHRPAIHFLKLHDQQIIRYVLSDWDSTGNALLCQADGTKRLISIS